LLLYQEQTVTVENTRVKCFTSDPKNWSMLPQCL